MVEMDMRDADVRDVRRLHAPFGEGLDDVERELHLEVQSVGDELHEVRRKTILPVLADAEVEKELLAVRRMLDEEADDREVNLDGLVHAVDDPRQRRLRMLSVFQGGHTAEGLVGCGGRQAHSV